ncbi:MAG: aspartate kinase, partial [Bacteroidota bacterium]|nr:aspartate kinase [Bacteroidota bacterium]
MQVIKFGGSSVASAENIEKVACIIKRESEKDKTVVVISAFSGITDLLLQAGLSASNDDESYRQTIQAITQRHLDTVKALLPITNQSSILSFVMQRCNEVEDICNGVFLIKEFSDKTKDRILSYGELLSSKILSAYLTSVEQNNCWKDARELISTDSHYTRAVVNFPATQQKIKEYFSATTAQVTIIPGFIASDEQGNTTTLGRGGSDYTAAIIAAVTDATELQIWTDVSGMMTADPRLVQNAKVIPNISYQEAMELSHFGAKVIYPPTIQPVMLKNIPVWIKNTFHPEYPGTVIHSNGTLGNNVIRGISSINKIALLSLEGSGMVGIPGFSKRLFETLANSEINIILITQASSEHSICIGIEESTAEQAKKAIDRTFSYEIETGKVEPVKVEKDLAIVALVGDNMKNHTGTSGKMFGAIGRNGVNVRAIAQGSSERNISAVIAKSDVKKAINVLHEEFFETTYKQINLFIAGAGNVGSKLLAQLRQQKKYLQDNFRLQIRVVGLANSRKMLFKDEGIDLNNWKEILSDGAAMNSEAFFTTMQNKNLRNSIFVDVTANEQIAKGYDQLLQKSISVVACNKIAC